MQERNMNSGIAGFYSSNAGIISNLKICNNICKKSDDSRISHSRSLRQLALKTLAGLFFAAATVAPVLAQTISCATHPATFNTGIAPDSDGKYSASSGRLNNGDPDTHWQFSLNGQNWSPSMVVVRPAGSWAQPTPNAQWIGDAALNVYGTIWYRYVFNLDPNIDDPSVFKLSLKLNVDDSITNIYINGTRVLGNPGAGWGSNTSATVTLSQGWKTGQNTLLIQTGNAGYPAGLLVQSTGNALCTTKLSVTKTTTQSTAVSANQTNIPFEIVVANKGADFPAGALLNDALPAYFASGAWTCSNDGTTAVCPAASGSLPISNLALGALPAGSSLRFNVLATAQSAANLLAASSIENTATLTLPTPFSAKDVCLESYDAGTNACWTSASVAAGGYLEISKTVNGAGPFSSGDTVSYDIALSNAGSVDLSDITVADTLPAGLSNGTWTCQVPAGSSAVCPALAPPASNDMPLNQSGITLPAHASLVYTVTATVDAVRAPGTLASTEATASTTAVGASCWNGSASSAPPCAASVNIAVTAPPIHAVPLWGRLGYWLTALGILALAAAATARRKSVR